MGTDPDVPEISNLQRQTLIDEDDVAEGRPKALAAAARLARANSEVTLEPLVMRLVEGNAERLLGRLRALGEIGRDAEGRRTRLTGSDADKADVAAVLAAQAHLPPPPGTATNR